MLSFVSKMMNKFIGERDYSAQETYHLLLKLPLYKDSCIVANVDCRPSNRYGYHMEFLETQKVVQSKQILYEKYLDRGIDMEEVMYFEFVEQWNFKSSIPNN